MSHFGGVRLRWVMTNAQGALLDWSKLSQGLIGRFVFCCGVAAAFFVALTIYGCGSMARDGTDFPGLYQLVRVNGASLPYRMFTDKDGDYEDLIEASLLFRSDQTVLHHSRVRRHIFGGGLVHEVEDTVHGTYTYRVTEVRIQLSHPDTTQVIMTRNADTLMIEESNGVRSFYVRHRATR
jgi:hypothetical protein